MGLYAKSESGKVLGHTPLDFMPALWPYCGKVSSGAEIRPHSAKCWKMWVMLWGHVWARVARVRPSPTNIGRVGTQVTAKRQNMWPNSARSLDEYWLPVQPARQHVESFRPTSKRDWVAGPPRRVGYFHDPLQPLAAPGQRPGLKGYADYRLSHRRPPPSRQADPSCGPAAGREAEREAVRSAGARDSRFACGAACPRPTSHTRCPPQMRG